MDRLSQQEDTLSRVEKESLFKEALSLCDRMAEIHHNYGIFLDSHGNTKEAREHFENAFKLDKRSEYQVAIARTLLQEELYTKADKIFRKLLQENPDDIKSLQGRAVVSERTGDMDAAIAHLTKALSYKPNNTLLITTLLFSMKEVSFVMKHSSTIQRH